MGRLHRSVHSRNLKTGHFSIKRNPQAMSSLSILKFLTNYDFKSTKKALTNEHVLLEIFQKFNLAELQDLRFISKLWRSVIDEHFLNPQIKAYKKSSRTFVNRLQSFENCDFPYLLGSETIAFQPHQLRILRKFFSDYKYINKHNVDIKTLSLTTLTKVLDKNTTCAFSRS